MKVVAAAALSIAILTSVTAFAKHGWTVKVLVPNALPGQLVVVFQGAYSSGHGPDEPGIAPLESTTPVALDGKVTELFVPVGIASAVWLWDEYTGYRFLANVAPSDSTNPIVLDASQLAAARRYSLDLRQLEGDLAFATIDADAPNVQHTVKVLTFNTTPGQVIAVFQGEYRLGLDAADPGIAPLASTVPANLDSKVTELFVPVGVTSAVWLWDEKAGYRFLDNVTPGSKSQPIKLDANEVK